MPTALLMVSVALELASSGGDGLRPVPVLLTICSFHRAVLARYDRFELTDHASSPQSIQFSLQLDTLSCKSLFLFSASHASTTVLLSTKNVKPDTVRRRTCGNLANLFIGPFSILER